MKLIKIEKVKVATVDLGDLYSLFVRKEHAEWDSYVELDFYEDIEQLKWQYRYIKTKLLQNSKEYEECKIAYEQMKDLFVKQNVSRIELYCSI